MCTDILSGKNTDVVEMDAASNNSVDDIRQMIEKVNFLPTSSKYRVYIIDEVHMLSTGAFNALLKTLEEPPLHCIFILATTEPQKLPATILSRCQRFDFKKLDNASIIKRLEIICKESNIKINKEALETIAILAEGSSRDSISILETCIGEDGVLIDKQRVKDIVGIPSLSYINKIIDSIVNYDTINSLNGLDEVLKQGKDLSNCVFEIIKYLKDILIYKVTNTLEIYSKEEIKDISKLAENLSKDRLLYLINLFIEVENSIKMSTQPLILVQATIIKASSNILTQNVEQLEERMSKLESMISSELPKIEIKKVETKKEETKEAKKVETKKEETKEAKKVEPKKEEIPLENDTTMPVLEESVIQDDEQYVSYWKDVLEKLKQDGKVILHVNLMKAKAREDGDTLLIEFENAISNFGKDVIEKPDNKKELTQIVSKISGKKLKIKYVEKINSLDDKKSEGTSAIESLDIPINIIDE